MSALKPKRALLSVTDKTGLVELARALHDQGAELVATGGTAKVLKESGLPVTPIEAISGAVEAFQGRMKTLSFPVCSGILYRRDDAQDLKDAERLKIPRIDVVVVNFYAFDGTIDQIDIGGPTLVRAAAKNKDGVLVLTEPSLYPQVIAALRTERAISDALRERCAASSWMHVLEYDRSIAEAYGPRKALRYGENPHQDAKLLLDRDSPIDWEAAQARVELSYNNLLDLSAAYELMSELLAAFPQSAATVIFKHLNPCGVSLIDSKPARLSETLEQAWAGDPISAFGGVIVFSKAPDAACLEWLGDRFVDAIAYPGADAQDAFLSALLKKRKNLKWVNIRRFGEAPGSQSIRIPGGLLVQSTDRGVQETFKSVTRRPFPKERENLARFGVAVCRSLKSNAVCLVRASDGAREGFQLIGSGQGQPNRIEALTKLCIPRARSTMEAAATGADLSDALLISDAFFPFPDAVEAAHAAGIQWIVQPGGSIKDAEVVAKADALGVGMAMTGVRHFRH